ncbi:MAG: M23 family metallopeptidase [Candidatus Obscuribacterales bacterium]|jgi:murein DD-endopeptidase MepM/ murein hydrolase activator NlpD|nr:M23 family metallopeptidase [Candidatus Obscuribacterales bacterium]
MTKTKLISLGLLLAAVQSAVALPSSAYHFEGYYVPCFLISPMKDEQVYTPVGLGLVTSKAGFRKHPVTGKGDFHNGVDLAANLNDKVYNLLDGMVTRVGYRGNLGVAVEVYHPYPNIRTICGHLNAYSVQPGMWVRRGQVIGFAGSTGRSTGVHLHYTIIKNDTNQYIEPMIYLSQVPEYVKALRTARIQAAFKKNADEFKKKQAEKKGQPKEEAEDDELPEEGSEEATAHKL